jgi:copper homeostasis protein
VTPDNVGDILRRTGVREIHLSARQTVRSAMQYRNERCGLGAFSAEHEYEWREANPSDVRRVREALDARLGQD